MKKIFIVIAAVMAVTGCAVIRPEARVVVETFADYSRYERDGFHISPNQYVGEFDSLGELYLYIKPALVENRTATETAVKRWMSHSYENITVDHAIEIAVKKAKERGADAMVNFRVVMEDVSVVDRTWGGVASGTAYHIHAYCIKRR